MYCKYYVPFVYFIKIVFSTSIQGWNYINIHCRDNENRPVDWWYMYKPPTKVIPFHNLGRDFVFITSDTTGRWQESTRHITANSLLQNTVSPMYRPTYSDYLAVVTYEERRKDKAERGSSSFGILMADEVGGVWIGHTVPGLLNLTLDRPSFPKEELGNGHLLVCLSLDPHTLNQLGQMIKEVAPRYSRIQIPTRIRPYLPNWNFLDLEGYKPRRGPSMKQLDFVMRKNAMQVKMIVRKQGEVTCPYQSFARKMNLVLDVYGHRDSNMPLCYSNYSVRIIDKISIKTVNYVHYINKATDRSAFAVSTAAYWQRMGSSGKDQYWTCTGSSDDTSDSGGLIMCVDGYEIWQSLDNLKVKEPQCRRS